jgi:hypothetical protein
MEDRGSRVRFPAGVGNFSLHRRVQKGFGAHPASYPMGTRGSFAGGKEAAGVRLTTPHLLRGSECVERYRHFSIRFYGMMFNYAQEQIYFYLSNIWYSINIKITLLVVINGVHFASVAKFSKEM